MLQIRTIINNEIKLLDLYGDEDIKLELSFAEVQDVTKKNSPFTQSFKLPGSKNNNTIFNYFYDTNASVFDFDIKEKFEAQLLFNGEVLYNGYLRLNSTTRTLGEIIYDVTFYSEVGDLVSNIADKYLSDLQLWETVPYEYNVTGYPQDLQYMYDWDWDFDLKPSLKADPNPLKNGKVYFSILNRGYSYLTDAETGLQTLNADIIPRLNYQKPPTNNNDYSYWNSDNYPATPSIERYVPRTYMTGALRVKDIYKSIFRENGYLINSDFFDTAYFDKIYLPLTTSNDGFYPVQSTKADVAFEGRGATTATSVNYACTDTYLGPPPLSGTYSRFITSAMTVDQRYFYHYPDSIYLAADGWYRFKVEFDYVSNSNGTFEIRLIQSQNVGTYTYCDRYGYLEDSVTFTAETGQAYEQQVAYLVTNNPRWSALRYRYFDFVKATPSNDIRITRFNVTLEEAPYFISGDTYEPIKEFVKPDIKQIDFISSINKLFNLVVIPDPENQYTLRVEPVIDWIGKGDTLDWTDKVNRDAPIKVQPLTTIINGTLDYDYTEDGASSNMEFKTLNDRKFGQNFVELDTDYRDSVLTFSNIFSAQVDSTQNVVSGIKGLTIPNYFASKTENNDGSTFVQFTPYKTTPKLLFRQPAIPTWSFGDYSYKFEIDAYWITNWSNNNRFITYPFGASGLTHALVWNKADKFDPAEYDLSDYEDLYDVYYKDYIEDLVDPENRLVEAQLYFDPYELRQLKFNEKIFLDGNYYRVNKIKNYSLTQGGLADVELIKLTREYQGHRVRYYDLINCTGGTDLHTSTDLNFGVYYLKGYNVKIDGDCYTISAGTYNSGYTYQALDLSDPYYECTCTSGLTKVNVYDEQKPIVTPTPIPPTQDCETDCTYYEWENENPFSASVQYKDCATGNLITLWIGPSNIATGCTCNDFTPIVDGGVRVNYSESCGIPVTPTPTPTSVTPTPTPTPTLTPNACYEYTVENENPYSVVVNFTNCCTGLADSEVVGAYQVTIICSTTAPTGPVYWYDNGFCTTPCPSATPTPSVTPTYTPTPSVTPSVGGFTYYYEVQDCDNPLLVGVVGSNTFYAVGKILKLSNGRCGEIIGTTTGPHTLTATLSYNSCETCPR